MPKGKKGFQVGNNEGFSKTGARPVSKTKVIHVRPYEDQVEGLTNVKDLNKKIRQALDKWIADS